MSGWLEHLPRVRGSLRRNVPLAPLTWLRVGGPAEAMFQPADADDLAEFLQLLPAEVPVLPMGVASNLLVRDGGISGVVIRSLLAQLGVNSAQILRAAEEGLGALPKVSGGLQRQHLFCRSLLSWCSISS